MGGVYIIDATFFIHGSRIHLSSRSLNIYWNVVNPFYEVLTVVFWLLGMLCLSGLASALQAGKINVHKNYSRAWGNLMPEIMHLLLNNIPSGTKNVWHRNHSLKFSESIKKCSTCYFIMFFSAPRIVAQIIFACAVRIRETIMARWISIPNENYISKAETSCRYC